MEQLDIQAQNLAKAIKRAETGEGDTYNARGKSGEFGAYQFMPETYKAYAKKYLGDENAEPNVENQNKIAYSFIKEKKDSGYNPAQIASMWNAGEGRPNAYRENFKGVNEYGVEYDTPGYVEKVSSAYKQIQGGKQEIKTTIQEKPKKKTGEKIKDIITSIFPGEKVGESIGTLAGYVATPKEAREYYDLSSPTPLQTIGDVAQGALTIGAGLGGKSVGVLGQTVKTAKPAATALGRIGQGAKLGAEMGLSAGLVKGETGAKELATETVQGGLIGGAFAGASELLRKASEVIPKRLLPFKVNEETAEYALTKKLQSPSKMLSESDDLISKEGIKLDKILSNKKYTDLRVPGRDIYTQISQELPDAQLSPDELQNEITKLAKLKKGLVNKLFTPEGLTIKELQTLNSEIGKNTFKTVFDTPETKAGKQIGNAVYHSIGKAIRAVAPETDEVYATLTKEYTLNNALRRYIGKSGTSKPVNLKDIVSFSIAGLPGIAAERIATSPTANLKTAGFIKNLGGLKSQQVQQGIKAPVLKGILGD